MKWKEVVHPMPSGALTATDQTLLRARGSSSGWAEPQSQPQGHPIQQGRQTEARRKRDKCQDTDGKCRRLDGGRAGGEGQEEEGPEGFLEEVAFS